MFTIESHVRLTSLYGILENYFKWECHLSDSYHIRMMFRNNWNNFSSERLP